MNNFSFRFEYSFKFYKRILPYSIGSFFADLFYRAPLLVTPSIVLYFLEAKASASVYFAWMIGWIITTPGQSLAASVFSEGSNTPAQLPLLIIRSLKKALLVTILISIITFIISPQILALFGKAYSLDATSLLKWLILPAILVVLNSLYFSILKVEKRIKELFMVSLVSATVYLFVTVVFIGKFGIVSTGLGWLSSQLVISLFAGRVLLLYARNK